MEEASMPNADAGGLFELFVVSWMVWGLRRHKRRISQQETRGRGSCPLYCPEIGWLAVTRLHGAANLTPTFQLYADEAELGQNGSAWSSQYFNLGQMHALVGQYFLFLLLLFSLAVKHLNSQGFCWKSLPHAMSYHMSSLILTLHPL